MDACSRQARYYRGMNVETKPKTALITGGARRIGATIAQSCHAQGYDVIIHCHQSRAEADKLAATCNAARPDSARVVQGPLGGQKPSQELSQQIALQDGGLDLLVNNASSFYPTQLALANEDDWDNLFNSNAKGPYFLAQQCLPWLQQAGGNIVNIVDIHAHTPMQQHSIYCMAKAALAMMTASLAKDLAPTIRVNGVSPGAILWPENDQQSATQQKILKRIPLKRSGNPEDIADTVLFLAQSTYITGQIIAVDGGRSLFM